MTSGSPDSLQFNRLERYRYLRRIDIALAPEFGAAVTALSEGGNTDEFSKRRTAEYAGTGAAIGSC
jgi:hypothetical protein